MGGCGWRSPHGKTKPPCLATLTELSRVLNWSPAKKPSWAQLTVASFCQKKLASSQGTLRNKRTNLSCTCVASVLQSVCSSPEIHRFQHFIPFFSGTGSSWVRDSWGELDGGKIVVAIASDSEGSDSIDCESFRIAIITNDSCNPFLTV